MIKKIRKTYEKERDLIHKNKKMTFIEKQIALFNNYQTYVFDTVECRKINNVQPQHEAVRLYSYNN